MISQEKRGIEIVKQSPGYDIDILCRAGVASRARCGIVAMEGNFGITPYYRRAVEKGALALEKHACATLTTSLRAAAFGVAVHALRRRARQRSGARQRLEVSRRSLRSGQQTYVIPAISPDFAVIHASCVDRLGNVRIAGTYHWDRIMSRAAKSVLVVVEEVSDEYRTRTSSTSPN